MTAGAFLGFIVFGISYIYVVIYIFYDINRSKHQYLEMIEEDKQMIKNLNVPAGIRQEWEEDLRLRLEGRVKDDALDDQLYGAAATMPESEFRQYMWVPYVLLRSPKAYIIRKDIEKLNMDEFTE